MTAVWRSSAPSAVSSGRITTWWWLFLGGVITGRLILPMYLTQKITEQVLLTASALSVLASVLYLVSGVLIVLIIKQITAWQSQPREVVEVDHGNNVNPATEPQ